MRGGDGDDKRRPAKKAPRKGPLTAEDEELWQGVARSVAPLERAKGRVPETDRSGLDTTSPHAAALLPQIASREGRSSSSRSPLQPTPPVAKVPPPLAQFDRKRSRRIAAGRIEIEARLDLHGARLVEAHDRLRAFIAGCASRGLSTVLVVTGKGGTRPEKETEIGFATAAPERGVLRRSVPMWLDEPELRLQVASYTTADIKHGGGGALYIHLRRRKMR